jgi:hypothetical protein
MEREEVTLVSPQAAVSQLKSKGRSLLFAAFGGWLGTALFAASIMVAVGLFFARSHLAGLGHLSYIGVFLIAFLGNVSPVPAFTWLFLVAPLSGLYPTWALIVAGVTGAGLGEMVPYFLGNSVYSAHKSHPWVSRLSRLPKWTRFIAVFGISLSPIFSCPGLASGVLRVRLWAMILMKVTTEAFKLWLVLEAFTVAQRILLR